MTTSVEDVYDRLLAPVVENGSRIFLSQLNDLLPLELSPDEIDALFLLLDEKGVEVVDDERKVARASGPPEAAGVEVREEEASPAAPSETPDQIEEEEQVLLSTLRWYKAEIGRIPRLAQPEERTLGLRCREGDDRAVAAMVEANLRLVVRLARDYARSGVPLMDLIQAGNEGLLEAVRHYDPDRHGRFGGYATWWIRRPMVRHVAANYTVMRVPEKLGREARRVVGRRRQIKLTTGRDPTAGELADELGLETAHVEFLLSLDQLHLSLDAPLEGKDGVTLEDTLPDESVLAPDEETIRQSVRARIIEALGRLETVEQRVLTLLYGLQDDVPKSPDEVSRLTGIGREKIRQIEARALEKLRELSWERSATAPD